MNVHGCIACALVVSACAPGGGDVVIDLASRLDGDRTGEVTATIDLGAQTRVRVIAGDTGLVLEGWLDGGELAGTPDTHLAAGASREWLAPRVVYGELELEVSGTGERTLTVWARGAPVPEVVDRDRSIAWFDAELLDDPKTISFRRVMETIAPDGDGGALVDRWFRAFTGPGAGRATFAQFLDQMTAVHGADPSAWNLDAFPFRVTGVHNRIDLARGDDCGELRVSIASTHATFSPAHFIFLFHQRPGADDLTPDGRVHCLGTARRWARLTALDRSTWLAAARALLGATVTREAFAMAESVELTLSPWQWRQWTLGASGSFANPRLFQTLDVDRVNTPGPVRDAFLADVTANAVAIAARTWTIPDAYRASVAEVQPNEMAHLVDLAPLGAPLATSLPRALGMVGCPRCHTDDADFVQTQLDRRVSPFYDRELDARATRLEALGAGAWPEVPPFGPLQTF